MTRWLIYLVLLLLLGAAILTGKMQENLGSLQLLEDLTAEPVHHCLLAPSLCSDTTHRPWEYQLDSDGRVLIVMPAESAASKPVTRPVPDTRDYTVLLKGALLFDAARQLYARRLWLSEPRTAVFMLNLANLTSDPRDAIELYRLSAEISATFAAHYQLGRLLVESQENNEALASFRAAETLLADANSDGQRSNFYIAFGNLLLNMSEVSEANRHFESALRLRPGSVPAQLGIARTELALGESEQAAKLLEPLTAAEPRRADVHYWLARAYQSLDRRADAIEQLEEVVSLRRDFAVAWRILGDLRAEEGDMPGSVLAYRYYLMSQPEDNEVRTRLEQLELMLESHD